MRTLTCERALKKFKTVLAPENLTCRKHVAWRAEDATLDGFIGQFVMHAIKLGVARACFSDRLGIEPCPLSCGGKHGCIGDALLHLPQRLSNFRSERVRILALELGRQNETGSSRLIGRKVLRF